MKTTEIKNLMDLDLDSRVKKKMIKQANFAGLEQNLKTGDTITLKVGDELCNFVFDRHTAIEQHQAPDCASNKQLSDDTAYSFKNKAELSALLGVKVMIPDEVYFKALNDRMYLHNLLVSRGTPFLDVYLKKATTSAHSSSPIMDKKTTAKVKPEKLLLNFTKSVTRWGKSGFTKVDEETYNKRLKACAGCNLLADVPNTFLYKLMDDKKGSSGVCNSCGCLVSKKALLATDTCPEASLDNPKLNRWGELLDI